MATLAFALQLAALTQTAQSAESSGEYILKAAFLYNFSKFVVWPDGAGHDQEGHFVICVAGADPFGEALDAIEKKTANGYPIAIRRSPSSETLRTCNILFISASEQAHLHATVLALKGLPTLTVCDLTSCIEQGAMIGLRVVGNKIHMDVNLDAAQQASLQISSQLLRLATVVKRQ
ncbi:MAG: YfiR family protein [Nitrospira sp.]|nr:YfiR family protein [Nitrospira sp.]